MNDEVDFSEGVSSKLLPQLISSLKSSNPTIRDAALETAILLLSRCRTAASLTVMAQNLVKTLKDGISLPIAAINDRKGT